jgi:hypothetical protein
VNTGFTNSAFSPLTGCTRVAAVRRDDLAAQDRRRSGVDDERDVGVPAVDRPPGTRERVGLDVAEIHLGLTGVDDQHLVAVVGRHVDGMAGRERAERLAEGHVLLAREGLVAEEQHLPLEQRIGELGDGRRVERLAEVDAVHLGTDDRHDRPEVEPGWGVRGHAIS